MHEISHPGAKLQRVDAEALSDDVDKMLAKEELLSSLAAEGSEEPDENTTTIRSDATGEDHR